MFISSRHSGNTSNRLSPVYGGVLINRLRWLKGRVKFETSFLFLLWTCGCPLEYYHFYEEWFLVSRLSPLWEFWYSTILKAFLELKSHKVSQQLSFELTLASKLAEAHPSCVAKIYVISDSKKAKYTVMQQPQQCSLCCVNANS